jgi:hypothetical protein
VPLKLPPPPPNWKLVPVATHGLPPPPKLPKVPAKPPVEGAAPPPGFWPLGLAKPPAAAVPPPPETPPVNRGLEKGSFPAAAEAKQKAQEIKEA